MYAVVETDGKQYQVTEGKYIDLDLRSESPDTAISLDKVVAIIAGEQSQIGQPYVEGACIHGKVLKHGKSKKIVAYKMKQKKGYRIKKGHRQGFTRVLVENIEFPNKEETLRYAKELSDKKEAELKEKEDKLKAIKEKAKARKQKKKVKEEKTEELKTGETAVEELEQQEQATEEAVVKEIDQQGAVTEEVKAEETPVEQEDKQE